MAAFDLSELVTDLIYGVSAPGVNSFNTVTEDEWVGRLRNGFWNAFMDGFIREYIETEGMVTHRTDPNVTFPREDQQLIMMYTGIAVLQQQLLTLNTRSLYEAGPVKYETEKAASILKAILDSYLAQRNGVIEALKTGDIGRGFYLIDAFSSRQESIRGGNSTWVGD